MLLLWWLWPLSRATVSARRAPRCGTGCSGARRGVAGRRVLRMAPPKVLDMPQPKSSTRTMSTSRAGRRLHLEARRRGGLARLSRRWRALRLGEGEHRPVSGAAAGCWASPGTGASPRRATAARAVSERCVFMQGAPGKAVRRAGRRPEEMTAVGQGLRFRIAEVELRGEGGERVARLRASRAARRTFAGRSGMDGRFYRPVERFPCPAARTDARTARAAASARTTCSSAASAAPRPRRP